MRLLEWWSIPRKGWLVILIEFAVILGLSISLISEYLNNVYFQGYVNSLEPTLIPFLSVAFGIASGSIAMILYFNSRSIRRVLGQEILGASTRRRATARKSNRKAPTEEPRSSKPPSTTSTSVHRLRPVGALRSTPSRQRPEAPASDPKAESDE